MVFRLFFHLWVQPADLATWRNAMSQGIGKNSKLKKVSTLRPEPQPCLCVAHEILRMTK